MPLVVDLLLGEPRCLGSALLAVGQGYFGVRERLKQFFQPVGIDRVDVRAGSGNYCPENPVTRAQMAVFLVRTFDLP